MIFNNVDEIDPKQMFPTNPTNRTLRNSLNKIFKPHFNTKEKKNSFSYRIAQRWNELPEHIKNAPSTNSFKTKSMILIGSKLFYMTLIIEIILLTGTSHKAF